MIFGGFGNIKDYQEIKKAGYDYAELDMPEIEELSENDFQEFKNLVEKNNFPVLLGARILPVKEPLFFVEGFKPESLKNYLEKTCKRSSILGIKKIILGNGKARSFLTENDIKKENIFFEVLKMIAQIAANNDQELILEPLGPKYSNYINKISEAVKVIEKVNESNIFTMADLRHMLWSKDDFEDLTKYINYIHHIHIDYPESFPERKYPDVNDGYNYGKFFKAIKNSGYNGSITVEADIPENWNKAHDQLVQVLKKYELI